MIISVTTATSMCILSVKISDAFTKIQCAHVVILIKWMKEFINLGSQSAFKCLREIIFLKS